MPDVELYSSANLKFSELVDNSIKQMRIPRDIYTESYLTALLSKFISPIDFLPDKPFILRLFESEGLQEYVQIGDESLLITGFFPEFALIGKKKTYIIEIGKEAYHTAACILNYEGEGNIYFQLSKRFEVYSEVLNHVRFNMLEELSDDAFFQIYKLCRAYKNPKAKKKLEELTSKS